MVLVERNWAGNLTYRAGAVLRPATHEKLAEIFASGWRVRVLGSSLMAWRCTTWRRCPTSRSAARLPPHPRLGRTTAQRARRWSAAEWARSGRDHVTQQSKVAATVELSRAKQFDRHGAKGAGHGHEFQVQRRGVRDRPDPRPRVDRAQPVHLCNDSLHNCRRDSASRSQPASSSPVHPTPVCPAPSVTSRSSSSP